MQTLFSKRSITNKTVKVNRIQVHYNFYSRLLTQDYFKHTMPSHKVLTGFRLIKVEKVNSPQQILS